MQKKRTTKLIKILSLAVAFVLCVTMFPLMGEKASADSDSDITMSAPDYDGVFDVYSTYFFYNPYTVGGNTSYYTSMYGLQYPKLYMEYSANSGKTWKRSGYMQYDGYTTASNIQYTIKGLKPNTKYRTRIYYGDNYGNRISPYRYTKTIKTGKAKAPKIKSVKIKAVKIKYHKRRVAGHYYWTGYSYVWIRPYTEKYYSYKLKVTVKLKKKPGTKGVYVGLGGYGYKYVKGNKKTYKVTFTPLYGGYRTKRPPKGLGKKTVSVASYQSNASWRGHSPLVKRKRKVR